MNHVRRVAWASAVYALIVACILGVAWSKWPRPLPPPPAPADTAPTEVRLDSALALRRDPNAAGCDQVRAPGRDFADVHLAVAGMDTGLQAVGCDDRTREFTFLFRHTRPNGLAPEADEAVWAKMIGRPLEIDLYQGRRLGYDLRWVREGSPMQHLSLGQGPLVLRVFQWWSPAAILLVLYVWSVLAYLARWTALIRDAAPPDTPLVRRTFSLAKAQMAWWFAIVFAAFVFLWLVTGEAPSISGQALALLGLSSATTMASTALVPSAPSNRGSAGEFFTDLLSDEHGVAIHRFQMLVMTIALGLIFLFDVATKLVMPEFDGSLITLLGISSATYVGLKIPEQRAGATPPPPPDAPPAPLPVPAPVPAPLPDPAPPTS